MSKGLEKATNHYLGQWWHICVIKAQWVNPGRCGCSIKAIIFILASWIDTLCISCDISISWMPQTLLMACQHWFRWWLGVNGQQAITWTNVDQVLWCHMASLGHNDLKKIFTFGSSLNCIPCFAYPLAWQPGASKTASQARETCLVYVMQSHVGEATFFQAKQVKKWTCCQNQFRLLLSAKSVKSHPLVIYPWLEIWFHYMVLYIMPSSGDPQLVITWPAEVLPLYSARPSAGTVLSTKFRANSRFAPSQWETALLCNNITHWLGASLESALKFHVSIEVSLDTLYVYTLYIYMLKILNTFSLRSQYPKWPMRYFEYHTTLSVDSLSQVTHTCIGKVNQHWFS